jgi:predicted acylesterase/phospholipase RssA
MHHLGLALSGGGFRATLYHLGVVRFLRDAKILPKVTHIATVSGGSILGAHLTLNWDSYCGSDVEFEQASEEIVRFVQMDVRNRIVRRFPAASSLNMLRRMLRLGTRRQLTRPGLLEQHYEKFLYGKTSLFQLPVRPQLHILSTNVSEGRLCSFNREGLLRQRRVAGQRDRFERVHLGLATVPMAVAASSAFPGFFPPLELSGWDVGADEAQFTRQSFTDGGVFDNLGLRMFRCIEQSWVHDATPLRREDFLELEAATSTLMSADSLPEQTPIRRLRDLLTGALPDHPKPDKSSSERDSSDAMIEGLWEVIRSEELFRDPSFQNMELADPSAQALLHYVSSSNHKPDLSDRLWLNRQIVNSVFRQTIGKPCLRTSREGFAGILVSDAGAPFKVKPDRPAGGLIRTGMRATDILMDRVWQLELEAFENLPGVLFFPMRDVVECSQDRFAPHPEIQRQAARIRTDLDRFSDLEISALVQHGYCVARKACQGQVDFFGTEVPTGAPWDPLQKGEAEGRAPQGQFGALHDERQAMPTALRLRHSSMRRVWSTLFDVRDWPTYLWVPLLAALVLISPYTLYKLNKRAQQQSMVLSAIAETSPLYRKVLQLLESGPVHTVKAAPFLEVETLAGTNFDGFEIVSDTRVFDLRGWGDPTTKTSSPIAYGRLRVRRTEKGADNTHLRFQLKTVDEELFMSFKAESLQPTTKRMRNSDGSYKWQVDLDFSHVPIGSDSEIVTEAKIASDMSELVADVGRFQFTIPHDTGLVQIWMLMPIGRRYDFFEISGFPIDHPELAKTIVPDTTVDLPLGAIATFRLINPKADHRYECRWKWSEDTEPAD